MKRIVDPFEENEKLASKKLPKEWEVKHLNHDEYVGAFTKVKVLKTKLAFSTKYGQEVEFQKRNDGDLHINLYRPKVVSYETCDLGHDHPITKNELYEFNALDKSHINQLINWLQSGDWIAKGE